MRHSLGISHMLLLLQRLLLLPLIQYIHALPELYFMPMLQTNA